MKKTLPSQLLAYLQQQGDFVAGAALSRLEWPKYAYNERRGTHSPRSVIRRLEEMVEDKELVVEYRHGLAYYSAQKKATYPKTVYDGPKAYQINSSEEEEKWRHYQSQKASMATV